MHFIYIPDLTSSTIFLEGEALRHTVRVMRKKEADQIMLVDGKGQRALGTIQHIGKKAATVLIEHRNPAYQPLKYKLSIGLAPTKNIARTEWFLEKATEIGISAYFPFVGKNSERPRIKIERLQAIAIAAMKQSQQAFLPDIRPLRPFEEIVNQLSNVQEKFICSAQANDHLNTLHQQSGQIALLIGPEGDFSEGEISFAKDLGFIPVHLGSRRLRTETAGVVACTLISQAYER